MFASPCNGAFGTLVLVLLAGFLSASATNFLQVRERLPCPASTKIHLPIGEAADGSTIWSKPFQFGSQQCQAIGRFDVEHAKICGPGVFVFSPTSCAKME